MVLLRPFTSSDLAFVREHLAGPEHGEYTWFGWTPPKLQARFEADGLLGPDGGRLIIDDAGHPVGSVEHSKAHWGPTESWCWEIGIQLRADARGRGIGTRAQVLLRDYLFDHTRAERIQATTDIENRAEQRALEKAGFQREGVVRSAIWRAGAWHDQVLYAFLRSER